MLKLLWFAFLLIAADNSHAQSTIKQKLVHYTTTNGLSNNYVTGLVQDGRGFIWVSTDNGLNRLDGKEIQHLFQIPGQKSLIKDKLTALKVLDNNLLVSSSNGAQWINVNKKEFTNLLVSEKLPGSPYQNIVYDAVITHNKVCFITTHTGAYAFDSTGKLIFRYDHNRPDASGAIKGKPYGQTLTQFDNYRVLHFDRDYNMFVYDGHNNTFKSIEAYKDNLPGLHSVRGSMPIRGRFSKDKIIFLNYISDILMAYDVKTDRVRTITRDGWSQKYVGWASNWLTIDDSTALLYGGEPGLHRIHINNQTLHTTSDSISDFDKQICTVALLDREKRLWVGTNNGLYKQNIKEVALHVVKHPLLHKPGIDYPIPINSILRKKAALYVGSYTNLPIAIMDAEYKLKKHLSFLSLSKKCNQIWHIMDFKKDTVWFATQDGLIWYNESDGKYDRVRLPGIDSLIQHRPITILFRDSKGLIWLQPEWGQGVIMFNPHTQRSVRFQIADKKNYLPLRVANFVTEDGAGNVWFAENGLTRWNRKKEAFDTLITSYSGYNKENIKITSLGNDEKGNLVFCNENNGVLRFDPRTGKYKHLGFKAGLQENSALSAHSLNNNYLWVVTHNYITGIDNNSTKAVSYSYPDSLPASLYYTMYHDKIGGKILFGYENQFVWTEDRVTKKNTKSIPFYIDAVYTSDSSVFFPGEELSIKHYQNDINIHCTALNFDEAESNRYAYRINQKEWISLGTENSIHFSNLSPGRYQVQIKYYAVSNPQSETIRQLMLYIEPPFWKTWWFSALIVLSLLTLGYILYRKRIERIKHKARIDRQIAESEIKALRAQMNPHFIFNSLNSIMEMVLHDDKINASRYLSSYAQLIRLNLEHSERRFITLKENLDYLNLYIGLEQIRTDNFEFSMYVGEAINIEEVQIPPMLIQPVIENAIWYGPSPTKKMKLSIKFLKIDDQLHCEIEDNGIGIEVSMKNKIVNTPTHNPMGIGNVRQRLQILNEKYKMNCCLLIEDKSKFMSYDSGTKVTLILPLNFNDL